MAGVTAGAVSPRNVPPSQLRSVLLYRDAIFFLEVVLFAARLRAHGKRVRCTCVAPRYTGNVTRRIVEPSEYAALAEIRYRIRQFVRGSDQAAMDSGLEPQQYQLLLTLRALPRRDDATIRRLSERLFLKHHSIVGMVDRLEARGYVRRVRGIRDQRQVLVTLLPNGRRALESVVQKRLHELRESTPILVEALSAILSESSRAKRDERPVRRGWSARSVRAKRKTKTPSQFAKSL